MNWLCDVCGNPSVSATCAKCERVQTMTEFLGLGDAYVETLAALSYPDRLAELRLLTGVFEEALRV